MNPAEHRVAASCPACGATSLLMRTVQHEVPYFGEALETVLRCESCGFRHADFLVVEQKDPVRFRLAVRPDTLGARVVRASSCTWRIPELGFAAEPTARSESFVSNVEGVLDRARDILVRAYQVNADEPAKQDIAERLLERLARIVAGEERATLVLEDPFGNSLIAHPEAEREALTPEEVAELETGFIVFERDEVGA